MGRILTHKIFVLDIFGDITSEEEEKKEKKRIRGKGKVKYKKKLRKRKPFKVREDFWEGCLFSSFQGFGIVMFCTSCCVVFMVIPLSCDQF